MGKITRCIVEHALQMPEPVRMIWRYMVSKPVTAED